MGLLLYRGGMVCARDFTDMAAEAICRNMDYSRAKEWTSSVDGHFFDVTRNYDMKLEDVRCYNPYWESCSHRLYRRCGTNYGVFLSCQGIEREFLFFPSPFLGQTYVAQWSYYDRSWYSHEIFKFTFT